MLGLWLWLHLRLWRCWMNNMKVPKNYWFLGDLLIIIFNMFNVVEIIRSIVVFLSLALSRFFCSSSLNENFLCGTKPKYVKKKWSKVWRCGWLKRHRSSHDLVVILVCSEIIATYAERIEKTRRRRKKCRQNCVDAASSIGGNAKEGMARSCWQLMMTSRHFDCELFKWRTLPRDVLNHTHTRATN